MDPNANLAEQRELAAKLLDDSLPPKYEELSDVADDARRLAELVQALDEWLSDRGFRPAAWKNAR